MLLLLLMMKLIFCLLFNVAVMNCNPDFLNWVGEIAKVYQAGILDAGKKGKS